MHLRWSILVTLLAGSVVSGARAHPYKETVVKNGGVITGTVKLQGPAPKRMEFEVTKDNDWCGKRKRSPRLAVGKENGVALAVVSLENVSSGSAFSTKGKYILDQRKCEYEPHILLFPVGAELEILNNDGVLHNVHTFSDETGRQTQFNIALPIRGFRFPVKSGQFASPGIHLVTCDAGHPWMSAYIVAVENPYTVLTDANGAFQITDVPPGTYRIKMWHEGVAVTKTELENGKPKSYQYETPYQEIREVVVPASGKVSVDFRLILRNEEITQK